MSSLDVPAAPTTRPRSGRWAVTVGVPVAAGATGMAFVGGSVATSAGLVDAPMFTVQALRYTVACLLLLGFARITGAVPPAPRGPEWLWLAGVTGAGLVLFNIALVEGSRHAEPAVLGVAVACVPLLLAVIGPLQQGRRARPTVLAAALVVTAGAVLVQGFGRSDAAGLAWSLVVLGCEASFTLLAVPLLRRHGPVGVSVHTTWLAALVFAVVGGFREGVTAVQRLRVDDVLAGAYLAVAVTAVAFVLWYLSVERLGAARAGLLTGVAPLAAAGTGIALGAPAPQPVVWAGVLTVAAGLALGLRAPRRRPASG